MSIAWPACWLTKSRSNWATRSSRTRSGFSRCTCREQWNGPGFGRDVECLWCARVVWRRRGSSSRIQAEFPEFDLVEVLSEGSYESLDHADFDLVISTVPVRETAAPVVVVSPLLSAGDVKAVGIHS